jgi:hypothetical protein
MHNSEEKREILLFLSGIEPQLLGQPVSTEYKSHKTLRRFSRSK